VGAGARIDTGTITIRKVPYYRAHLKIDCGGVAELRIFLREQPESTHPCKPDLLLRGLRPGSTRLGVESTDSAKWGTVELTISDKNISVPVVLAPAVEVRGRVITADGAAAPSGSVRLVISNTERPTSNVTQSEEGEFVHKASWGAQSVEARVLTADAYLSEIRYGGRRLTERTFDPVPGAELEVVLGRPAASLAATATRDGQVAPANVLAVRWPIDPKAPLGTQITAISSPSGLAPGEYRVVAIPFNARWEGEAEFRRLLESGQTVRLEPGEKRTLMLELPR
jgi:hypothetical protein